MIKPKQFYIDRVQAHYTADNIIRGTGWNGQKGCAIGCTLENYSHFEFEKQGIAPQWFARVEDKLFEGMSELKSRNWPLDCLTAIPDRLHGDTKNPAWDKILGQFLVVVLKSTLETFDHGKYPQVKIAIEDAIILWERNDIGSDNFKTHARKLRNAYAADAAADAAAAAAAYAAAYAADAAAAAAYAYAAYAAYAAAYAYAADAAAAAYAAYAYAADAAAAAAAAAAYAYAYAADAAAAYSGKSRVAKYDYFADELLRILKSY